MIRILRGSKPTTKKRVIEIKVAGFIGRWFMKRKWDANTIPVPFFVFIFYWVKNLDDSPRPSIRVHEMVHVAQDERNSFFLMSWVKYGIESWKNGYLGNKYEREAYLIQRSWTDRRDLPDWAKEPKK